MDRKIHVNKQIYVLVEWGFILESYYNIDDKQPWLLHPCDNNMITSSNWQTV